MTVSVPSPFEAKASWVPGSNRHASTPWPIGTVATNGALVTTVPIGQGVDACRFDPGTQLAFASNGDGTLTVIHEDTPGSFTVVANVATKRGARTMELDPKTHRVFTATADFGPPPAATAQQPRPRPTVVPGTFALLVLDP